MAERYSRHVKDRERLKSQYTPDPPVDSPKLQRALKILRTYSEIPEDELVPHLKDIHEKAYAIFPFPCIGAWRFLDLYLTNTPEYPGILERVKAGAVFLDAGCCFGQVLRQLQEDGAPGANLIGVDLHQEYIDLGYALFRDRAKFAGRFLAGDLLDPADANVRALEGRVDVVHAASLFHLFDWDDQVQLGVRLAALFRPGAPATVLGRQVGNRDPPEVVEAQRADAAKVDSPRFRHNEASMQLLWDSIGERTGTKWKVSAQLRDFRLEEPSGPDRVIIRFVVTKVI